MNFAFDIRYARENPNAGCYNEEFWAVSQATPLRRVEINGATTLEDLILTPGIYNLSQSLNVTNPDTLVLGLGFPTLIPQNGIVSMQVANAPGIMISGLIFDAGTTNSPELLQVGSSAMHNKQPE